MTINTTPVQNSSIYKATRLNNSITALDRNRQSSFGRELITFSPVSIAVNQAFDRSGFDPAGKPFTSIDLLRGRSSVSMDSLNTFLSGAAFSSTYKALGSNEQEDVRTLVASILSDNRSENNSTYDRLGRIHTVLQESAAA